MREQRGRQLRPPSVLGTLPRPVLGLRPGRRRRRSLSRRLARRPRPRRDRHYSRYRRPRRDRLRRRRQLRPQKRSSSPTPLPSTNFPIPAPSPRPTTPSPTPADGNPTAAPVVAPIVVLGTIEFTGISVATLLGYYEVFEAAIAIVAGVNDVLNVNIVSVDAVPAGRRRLSTSVSVGYEILTTPTGSSAVQSNLNAAAADPALMDTAVAEASSSVTPGTLSTVSTLGLTSWPAPTPAPTPRPSPSFPPCFKATPRRRPSSPPHLDQLNYRRLARRPCRAQGPHLCRRRRRVPGRHTSLRPLRRQR